jgi:3-deoxy-D-manno-octulosonic-acid transferase
MKTLIAMRSPGLFFYSLIFPFILQAARLLGIFFPGLGKFFRLRVGLLEELEQKLSPGKTAAPRLWVHAASVGEFEQARPVITALKEKYPGTSVFVSFFSDSGFNARKHYHDAAAVFYLPTDTRSNARRLMTMLDPDILLLMRYDFWPNHLLEAKKHGTRLVLAAAVLQSGSQYLHPLLKGFYRDIFSLFDRIWTVSDKDTTAFRTVFNCEQAETAGDPRFDQVVRRSMDKGNIMRFRPFFENRTVLVAGSIWEKDEELLIPAWKKLEKKPALILVPHKVDIANIGRLLSFLDRFDIPFILASALDSSFEPDHAVLVIDETGYLAELYSLASFAYVGGGFGVNVHNTLEPAVHGIPVLFGPRIHNSPEAEALCNAGGATIAENGQQLYEKLETFMIDKPGRKKAGNASARFIDERRGATDLIENDIARLLFRPPES